MALEVCVDQVVRSYSSTRDVNDSDDEVKFLFADPWITVRDYVRLQSHAEIDVKLLTQMIQLISEDKLISRYAGNNLIEEDISTASHERSLLRMGEEMVRLVRNVVLLGHETSHAVTQPLLPVLLHWLGSIGPDFQILIGQILASLVMIPSPELIYDSTVVENTLAFRSNIVWRTLVQKLNFSSSSIVEIVQRHISADKTKLSSYKQNFKEFKKHCGVCVGVVSAMGGVVIGVVSESFGENLVVDENNRKHVNQLQTSALQMLRQFFAIVISQLNGKSQVEELMQNISVDTRSEYIDEYSRIDIACVNACGDFGNRNMLQQFGDRLVSGPRSSYSLCLSSDYFEKYGHSQEHQDVCSQIITSLTFKIPSKPSYNKSWSATQRALAGASVEALSRICLGGVLEGG